MCGVQYPDSTIRWGARGDYALALAAMRDNGLEIVEVVHESLMQVSDAADIYLLRDWRYPQDSLARFLDAHPGTKTVLDLRISPPEIHFAQRDGEMSRWLGHGWARDSRNRCNSNVLSMTTVSFVGSQLNWDLLQEIHQLTPNMRMRGHVTPWNVRNGTRVVATTGAPTSDYREFRVLFVGRCVFRKGLPRLVQALRSTPIRDWRLTVVTESVDEATGILLDPRGASLEGTEVARLLFGDDRIKLLFR